MAALSARSYFRLTQACSWEEIWEAGPYFARFAELLEDAQHYAVIAGWQIDSRLPMPRPYRRGQEGLTDVAAPSETLREKCLRICESRPGFEFFILIWDHSYLYVPERELWQGRRWDQLHPNVHFVFDNRHVIGGAHHEKICLFDGQVGLCGGIDLCADRWDTASHLHRDPRRSLRGRHREHGPYHDVAVQVTGPVCAELVEHLGERWRALSSVPFPRAPRPRGSGGHAVYLSRTSAEAEGAARERPRLVREVEFLFRDLIDSAEKRIWLEGQYFWSGAITDWLLSKMRRMRGRDFELRIVLAELARGRSFTRKMAPYEFTLLDRLIQGAHANGTRLELMCPYSDPPPGFPDGPSKPIYVHSKLLLIDDRYLCVGSANFASRALRIDTEVCLTFEARTESERAHLRHVARRMATHWEHLKPLIPTRAARAFPRRGYRYFFDPIVPWGYLLQRRARLIARRRPLRAALAGAGASALAAIAVLWLARAPEGWAWIYASLLSSSWISPVPFLATALVCSAQLGGAEGARIAICSMWVAAIFGYLAARTFPRQLGRALARRGPGDRSFEAFIRGLADPRVSLRAKVAYTGLYCTPLPWLFVGMGLVLPGACSLACRAVGALAPRLPAAMSGRGPAVAVGALLAWSGLRALGDLRRSAPRAA